MSILWLQSNSPHVALRVMPFHALIVLKIKFTNQTQSMCVNIEILLVRNKFIFITK